MIFNADGFARPAGFSTIVTKTGGQSMVKTEWDHTISGGISVDAIVCLAYP